MHSGDTVLGREATQRDSAGLRLVQGSTLDSQSSASVRNGRTEKAVLKLLKVITYGKLDLYGANGRERRAS